MKRLLAAALMTVGLIGFSANEANAQWITRGYWGTSTYYPYSYYGNYYRSYSPGYNFSFRYYDHDHDHYRRSRYRHYDRHDRWDRHDRHDHHDRYDRHDRWDRHRW